MVCKVTSLGLHGISGFRVETECALSGGLPGFDVVGLADSAVREARERVRSAAKVTGFKFPPSRITVNLAPADVKKSGTLYDLPILLSILAATGALPEPPKNAAFIGEVSLSGELRPVPGVLPMAITADSLGITELYVPAVNADEATLADGPTVYPVESLERLALHLLGTEPLAPQKRWLPPEALRETLDFRDVKGQENAKRALEIAAAGSHNILLIGPPGSGKSMLAKRLPSILPDMSRQEALETTVIHSVAGLTARGDPFVTTRPFRSPHHRASAAALAGGGQGQPVPGEISLAHNGVLFLDELPEFQRDVLEVLRQPLEDGEITVSRASGKYTFPSAFMLVCAMNPCRCGWYGSGDDRCHCTPASVAAYRGRISGPLLDRIDLRVEVPALDYSTLSSKRRGECSADIKLRVDAARRRQSDRLLDTGVEANSRIPPARMRDICALNEAGDELMKRAFERFGLTARSYDRILRVARTIADLDASDDILPDHLAEAIQFRTMEVGNEDAPKE